MSPAYSSLTLLNQCTVLSSLLPSLSPVRPTAFKLIGILATPPPPLPAPAPTFQWRLSAATHRTMRPRLLSPSLPPAAPVAGTTMVNPFFSVSHDRRTRAGWTKISNCHLAPSLCPLDVASEWHPPSSLFSAAHPRGEIARSLSLSLRTDGEWKC